MVDRKDDLPGRLSRALERSRFASQAELATHLGKRDATVSNWFTGISVPSYDMLRKLCCALDVSGHWLLMEEGDMRPADRAADSYRVDIIGTVSDRGVEIDHDTADAVKQLLRVSTEDQVLRDLESIQDGDGREGTG